MFFLFLEISLIVLIVILADQGLLLCPHKQVVDSCVEHEVHNRLVVSKHLAYFT